MNTKPDVIVEPNFDGIPAHLSRGKKWAAWRWEEVEGKPKKKPRNPVTGGYASFLEPSTWVTLDELRDAFKSGEYDGIAYAVVPDDRLVQIDVDLVESTQKRVVDHSTKVALALLKKLDCYVEFSSSGSFHGYVRGEWPRKRNREKVDGLKDLEVYDSQKQRFMYLTGQHVRGPKDVTDNQEALNALAAQYFPLDNEAGEAKGGDTVNQSQLTDTDLLLEAGFNPKFQRLMEGDISPYHNDESRADYALAGLLTFYTADPDQIRRIMEQSKLRRDKWDREDYLPNSIAKVLAENKGKPKWSPYRLTIGGMAQRFVDRCSDDFKYVPELGRWYFWNGKCWELDRLLRHERAVQGVVQQTLLEARLKEDKRLRSFALSCDNAGAMRSILAMAKSHSRFTAALTQFDKNPLLVTCNNGTLDLATLELREHNPADMITKMVNADYEPGAHSETWHSFLQDSFKGMPEEVLPCVQRLAGYTLTGGTSEKIFMLLYGPTNSGKSTFLDALLAVMGSYGEVIPFDALLQKRDGSENQPQLAKLPGVRFVAASESEEGKRWNAAMIKTLTGGGDAISVSAKYQNPFTYVPVFKLWLATNHRPTMAYDNAALWARIVCLHFPHEKKGPHIKKGLKESFKQDPRQMSAILAWMVEGHRQCMACGGVNVVKAIAEQLEGYQKENNPVADFVEDRCTCGAELFAPTAAVYRAYVDWFDANHAKSRAEPLSQRKLTDLLERCYGVRAGDKKNGQRILRGITLTDRAASEQQKY